MPVEFGVVHGDFDCSNNWLTTLKGCPKVVTGHFNCASNDLTNLDYLPEAVDEGILCANNPFIPTKELIKIISHREILDSVQVLNYLRDNLHKHYGLSPDNPLVKEIWKELYEYHDQ